MLLQTYLPGALASHCGNVEWHLRHALFCMPLLVMPAVKECPSAEQYDTLHWYVLICWSRPPSADWRGSRSHHVCMNCPMHLRHIFQGSKRVGSPRHGLHHMWACHNACQNIPCFDCSLCLCRCLEMRAVDKRSTAWSFCYSAPKFHMMAKESTRASPLSAGIAALAVLMSSSVPGSSGGPRGSVGGLCRCVA